ncbi:hypothetical protein ACJJTC_011323 [Scirpophaga incertulas]
MEFNEIKHLFNEWNIPTETINEFIENGVTVELLPKLTADNYKELCPHLATRIKIQEKVTELITAHAPTESVTTKTSDDVIIGLDDIDISISQLIPITVSDNKSFKDFDLHTLLQTTPGGNSILKFYKTNGHLNTTKRNQLTDIIIKHIYTNIVNSKITYEDYNFLAAKIITLFPKEAIGTYFAHPIKKRDSLNGRSIVARGKLVDKVRNLYKYGDRKRAVNSGSENIPPSKTQRLDLNALHSQDVLWLKHNSEPWNEVLEKWKNTFHIRRECKFDNIHDFFSEWNILCDIRSDSLISTDFDLLYPNKGNNLYLNWGIFFDELLKLKPTQDVAITELIQDLANISDDAKLPTQIEILARLIPPRGRLSKKVKFSTQEAIESIFILAKSAGDIDAVISKQKEKAYANKISKQPYIILQGTLHSCASPVLIIDDVRYQFRNIQKAFDILFKAYHVLDARYPRAGDYLYLIIQRCVYKIHTKYDNVVSYISDILTVGQ